MVIPMCPQQPGGQAMGGGGGGGYGGPGPMMPPPPPFPFPPPFMMGGPPGGGGSRKKKKKSKSKRSRRSKRRSGGTGSRRHTYESVFGEAEGGAEFTEGEEVTATEHLEGEEGEGTEHEGGDLPEATTIGQHDGEFSPRVSGQSGVTGLDGLGPGVELGPGEGQIRTSLDQGQQGQIRRSFGSQGQQGQQGLLGFNGGAVGQGQGQRRVSQMDDGTIVTTIDFPPGEAESVDVLATQRRNPNEKNIDVVAAIQGGRAGPLPEGGERVVPQGQWGTQDGATVTQYKMPEGKDGYVSAKNL